MSKYARREFFKDRIVDNSPVEWKSCFNMYRIVFSKQEVQTFYIPNMFHYIITMQIFDNIGVPFFSIQFTELDAMDLILNIISQLLDINEFGGRETEAFPMIRMNKSGSLITDTLFIDLIDISHTIPPEIPFGESLQFCDLYQQTREVEFSIRYYNKMEQRMIKMMAVPVCFTEALDIVDCLLCILADIELPTDQEEAIGMALDALDVTGFC